MKCPDCALFFEGDFCPNCGKPVKKDNTVENMSNKPETYNLCTICGNEYSGEVCPNNCSVIPQHRRPEVVPSRTHEIPVKPQVNPAGPISVNTVLPTEKTNPPAEPKNKMPIIIAALSAAIVVLIVIVVAMISSGGGGGTATDIPNEISLHLRPAGESEYDVIDEQRENADEPIALDEVLDLLEQNMSKIGFTVDFDEESSEVDGIFSIHITEFEYTGEYVGEDIEYSLLDTIAKTLRENFDMVDSVFFRQDGEYFSGEYIKLDGAYNISDGEMGKPSDSTDSSQSPDTSSQSDSSSSSEDEVDAIISAVDELIRSHREVIEILVTEPLPSGNPDDEGLAPVNSGVYESLSDITDLLEGTYTQSVANGLLTDPHGRGAMYVEKDGELHINTNAVLVTSLPVSWEGNYNFVLGERSETEVEFIVTIDAFDMTTQQQGTLDVVMNMVLVGEKWLLSEFKIA